MVFWLDPLLYRLQQLYTPSPHPGTAQVSKSQGWSVRDEDIRVRGDAVPPFQALRPSRQVEGPATKLRLPWCTWNMINMVKFGLLVITFISILSLKVKKGNILL